MANDAPHRIRVNRDEHAAKWVGRTSDGMQFFVTTPFVPALEGDRGEEFIAVYLWGPDGSFRDARIDNLGPRRSVNEGRADSLLKARIAELGKIQHSTIEVAPFEIERFGIKFGLIPQPPEEDDEEWTVIAEPGNYMAFYPPWDGDYDT